MDGKVRRTSSISTMCGRAEDTDRYGAAYRSVALSVVHMSTENAAGRLAYDDPSTPSEMGTDALATITALGWVPSTYTPREASKRGEIEIPEAATRLARAIYGDES